MTESREPIPSPNSAASFPTTHWSLILSAGQGAAPASHQALEELCRAYWTPLYAYLRHQGHSPHDAQDLTQGFLARVIAREDLGEVGPEKGRFRTFLLTGLRNFTIKQALRDKALKRGGGQTPLSINTDDAERLCGPDLTAESPELAFDRRWCRTTLALAIKRLREEHHARGKDALFEALAPFLDGADSGEYEGVAGKLGMAAGTVAVTVHRLRSRLQELIRAEVAQTVTTSEQVEEELKHLMDVWQR
ncbi:MAG: sigma-70 family RNA polymerase sigma factor [Verrucomicrobiota bacterium]